MTRVCCCPFGKKLSNKCGPGWRISPVYEVMIVLMSLVLGEQGPVAVAVPSQQKAAVPVEGFHSFHMRPLVRGQFNHYSQSRWKDLRKSGPEGLPWSNMKAVGNGSGVLGLTLVHRDARDSPFRANLGSQQQQRAENGTVSGNEADFATIFHNSVQRDVARVRAIDSLLGKKTRKRLSRRVQGVGPPLESPLFSGMEWGSGEYFTTLSIGTPPAQMLVTIDTGSDLLWLQCSPCASCYDQIDPIFDSSTSASYRPVPCYSKTCARLPNAVRHCDGSKCIYVETYGDGSFSAGEFASETVTMNSTAESAVEMKGLLFGCGHDNEGLFTASAGLLGLGRGQLSFPSQLSSALAPRFSYCLTDRFPSTSANGDGDGDGSGSGDGDSEVGMTATSYLLFGEAETASLQYTALLQNPAAPSFYYLQLTGLSVGNELVEIPAAALELDMLTGRGGVILDTGTAVTRLSSDAYGAMRDAFRFKARHLTRVEIPNQMIFDSCYQLAEGESVPSVTMHFAGDVDLELPIDNTIIPVDDSGSLYCLAFARSDVRGDLTIIGNVQQQGFRIEFDLGKGQVGFTQQACSLP